MNVWERLKEISPRPKDTRDCDGMYFNPEQYRVEYWCGGELACWSAMEELLEIGKRTDKEINSIIKMVSWPMWEFYADFFFPGWTINNYMKTGRSGKTGAWY